MRLLEECYKDEFDDLPDNEYIFGHEDGQKTILSPYRILIGLTSNLVTLL